MRTALILLLLLALASVAGSLVPQAPNSPERAAQFYVDHPFWGEVFYRTGVFDVFGSWWFTLIMGLLVVSLVACLIPRSRAAFKALRQSPIQVRELDSLPSYRELPVAAPVPEAVVAAEHVLRRRRFRVVAGEGGRELAAEKGALREAGSLVFHWSVIVLLAGAVMGKGTGYSGRATVVEGDSWFDSPAAYDGTLRQGRYFRGDHSGAGFELESFDDAFDQTGTPMDFVSTLNLISPDGSPAGRAEVRVNEPVSFEGLRIHQFGFGWAPEIRVRDGDTVLFESAVVAGQDTAPEGTSQLAMPWLGFVKLPSLTPQVAIRFELWPDGRAFFQENSPMTEEFQPLLRYRVYEGILNDPSLSSLDTRLMEETGSGIVFDGWTVDLERGCVLDGPPGEVAEGVGAACPDGAPGLALSFTDLRRYSVLQVTRDAGVPIVFAGAILLLIGLLPALYSSRRKVWVRVDDSERGSTLRIGGLALQRKPQFEEEFDRLVQAIAEATGGSDTEVQERVGAR
jgi:cytochrome c biogenesis protein